MSKPACPYCNRNAELATGAEIYIGRPDLAALKFWRCRPCDAYVGCHGDTTKPLGRLANASLRRAKTAAHAAFDPLWKSGTNTRKQAYLWLSQQLGIDRSECHIGMFDEARCRRVIELVREHDMVAR